MFLRILHSSEQIIVGSHSGVLRIYDPGLNESDKEVASLEFRPEHLLLELQLNNAVLQVETGSFVSGAETSHLSVLHARKLTVYCLQGIL